MTEADRAADAAEAMRVTAQDLKAFGVIDTIVPEPLGGAHRAPVAAITALGDAVEYALGELAPLSAQELKTDRRAKFLAMGRL